MLEIDNQQNIVFDVQTIVTDTQNATVRTFFGFTQQIKLTADKTTILANGTDTANITLQWQKFNTTTGQYEDDLSCTTPFETYVNGQNGTVQPTNGTATFPFTSAEPGKYRLITYNAQTNNASVEVTANV